MPVTLAELKDATNKDAILKAVSDFISNGWPAKISDMRLRPYFLCKAQLSLENGCIMRGHKIVIPESLHGIILKQLHSSHLGIVKTKAEARSRFWFPKIDDALESMISSCDVCAQLRPSPPRAPPAAWRRPPAPFSRVHFDLLGPIQGSMYLVVVDAYSKWVEVYDMKQTTTSSAVIERLCDFISRFGVPETLVSDNGTSFCSQEFQLFCKSNGVTHITSPVYHPASNGQAESFVKIVKKGIKSCLFTNNSIRTRKLRLLKYLMDYRNSVHSATGLSPAEIVFGRKMRSRLDIINPKASPPLSPSSTSNDFKCKKQSININKNNKIIKHFKINDQVFFKKYVNKDDYNWIKGTVVKRLGRVVYLLEDNVTRVQIKRHKNQIMLNKGKFDNGTNIPDSSPPAYLPSSPPPSPPASPLPTPHLSPSRPSTPTIPTTAAAHTPSQSSQQRREETTSSAEGQQIPTLSDERDGVGSHVVQIDLPKRQRRKRQHCNLCNE